MAKPTRAISYFYQTPCVGWVKITLVQNKITALHYVELSLQDQNESRVMPAWLQQLLDNFFTRKSECPSDVLNLAGSEFQLSVWSALLKIPFGETRSYQQIAESIQSAAIAVGQACKRNPVPILVPCHRVIAKQGIGGYEGAKSGFKLDRKKSLLRFEGINF